MSMHASIGNMTLYTVHTQFISCAAEVLSTPTSTATSDLNGDQTGYIIGVVTTASCLIVVVIVAVITFVFLKRAHQKPRKETERGDSITFPIQKLGTDINTTQETAITNIGQINSEADNISQSPDITDHIEASIFLKTTNTGINNNYDDAAEFTYCRLATDKRDNKAEQGHSGTAKENTVTASSILSNLTEKNNPDASILACGCRNPCLNTKLNSYTQENNSRPEEPHNAEGTLPHKTNNLHLQKRALPLLPITPSGPESIIEETHISSPANDGEHGYRLLPAATMYLSIGELQSHSRHKADEDEIQLTGLAKVERDDLVSPEEEGLLFNEMH